ncbi:acetyl-CoA synthetase-like protein [Ascoidea rubescens DSM 1968]|uniref:Acetyl-CoA synthetase-like protein n=1 Tax=Ascoidea rubescens DSM 1968 TaxID=1344418 RepID=A0A1D2VN20_9ASCO|nr:acetyl-CoA synthetase-like protein [Ascoidea rubescens DSM 1968]ODV62945.1 acetyl-CoA synthetase-like protein [Ascoidea rubescens DSM 1968]
MSETFPLPIPNAANDLSVDQVLDQLPLCTNSSNARVVPLENSKVDGYSPVFRNSLVEHTKLVSNYHTDIKTLFDNFNYALNKFNQPNIDKSILAYRKSINSSTQDSDLDSQSDSNPTNTEKEFEDFYSYLTFSQVDSLRSQIGSGVLYLINQIDPTYSHNFVLSIFAPNSVQWVLIDLACQAYSITNTALYSTLGNESSQYILKTTQSPILFTKKDKIDNIINLKNSKKISSLRIIISIDNLDNKLDYKLFNYCFNSNILLYDFKSLISIGTQNLKPFIPPNQNDIYTISFTSGTTSHPKGVQLTHYNALACLTSNATMIAYPDHHQPKSLFILPLAHIFARNLVAFEFLNGSIMYFPHNPLNPKSFLDDFKIVKPTHLACVPRVFTKIEMSIKSKLLNSKLLSMALTKKINGLRQKKYDSTKNSQLFLDHLIFNKIKKQLGFENLSSIVVGGAPIPFDTIEFLSAIFNIGVLQGYGLTESHSGFSQSFINDFKTFGSNGLIGPCVEMKFRDILDLNYTWDQNRSGEILIRGPIVFSKYYKDDEKTSEAFDNDGWFQTGDIGKLTDDNTLLIIDRVKSFFKLSQGEFVSTERIENFYSSRNSIINQLWIYGDSKRNFLVSIIGLELDNFIPYLKNLIGNQEKIKNLDSDSKSLILHLSSHSNTESFKQDFDSHFKNKLNQNLEIKKIILSDLNENIKKFNLLNFEKIKNIYIDFEPFSVDNKCLTPTLKIVRKKAITNYTNVIEALYTEGELFTKSNL